MYVRVYVCVPWPSTKSQNRCLISVMWSSPRLGSSPCWLYGHCLEPHSPEIFRRQAIQRLGSDGDQERARDSRLYGVRGRLRVCVRVGVRFVLTVNDDANSPPIVKSRWTVGNTIINPPHHDVFTSSRQILSHLVSRHTSWVCAPSTNLLDTFESNKDLLQVLLGLLTDIF